MSILLPLARSNTTLTGASPESLANSVTMLLPLDPGISSFVKPLSVVGSMTMLNEPSTVAMVLAPSPVIEFIRRSPTLAVPRDRPFAVRGQLERKQSLGIRRARKSVRQETRAWMSAPALQNSSPGCETCPCPISLSSRSSGLGAPIFVSVISSGLTRFSPFEIFSNSGCTGGGCALDKSVEVFKMVRRLPSAQFSSSVWAVRSEEAAPLGEKSTGVLHARRPDLSSMHCSTPYRRCLGLGSPRLLS